MTASTMRKLVEDFRKVAPTELTRSRLDYFLARVTEAVRLLQANMTRATNLIASFREVSAQRGAHSRQQFALAQHLEHVVWAMQPQATTAGHNLSLDPVDADITLDSYPGIVGDVIAALIENAVGHAFSQPNGHIRVAADKLGTNLVEISVSDDGTGVLATELEAIFDPFFTSTLGRGRNGLGLTIARNKTEIVLGGEIKVSSDSGATFRVIVPTVAPGTPAGDADADGAEASSET